MKKEKKTKNTIKLTTKKYTFGNIWHAFTRHLFSFLLIVLLGANIGAVLLLVAPKKNYISNCQIQYYGHKLDEYQQARITSLITCNESIDKYVDYVAAASIKHNKSFFNYSELSNGLSASIGEITENTKRVNFVISFSFKEAGYTTKVFTRYIYRFIQFI